MPDEKIAGMLTPAIVVRSSRGAFDLIWFGVIPGIVLK
jgi:hypothetical protein